MADDAQFDPLAGILTPQALQMQRLLQMQQLYQQAGQAPADNGQAFGARAAGLALGQGLSQGGQGNSPLDRLAQQNQQILDAPAQNVSADNPYEARAQVYEQKAKAFLGAGQYDMAQKFVNAAQIVRKQGLDAQKTQAESYKDLSQGQEANANNWEVKPVQNPQMPSGLEMARVNKLTGEVQHTGVPAPPQVSPANITLNQEKPFLGEFAKQLDTYKQGADQAVDALGMIKDARQKLDAGIISGTGSEARTQFGTMLQSLGFKSGGNGPVANTNAFIADTKQLALAARPAGMRMTNYEMQQLQAMTGSDTNLTPASIKMILDIRQRASEALINRYNKTSKTLSDTAASQKDESTRKSLGLASQLYPQIDIPDSSASAPSGVDAIAAKYLPK